MTMKTLAFREKSFSNLFSEKIIYTLPSPEEEIDEESIPNWVKEAQVAGNRAEYMALFYLRSKYGSNVTRVSITDSTKGYDIEVNNCSYITAYEVKAASADLTTFHITQNEIAASAVWCYYRPIMSEN